MAILLSVIIILALLGVLGCVAAVHAAMDRRVPVGLDKIIPAERLRRAEEYRTFIEKLPHEELCLQSFDGLKLAAHFYPYTADRPEQEPTGAYDRYAGLTAAGDAERRLVILCHGWRSEWWVDYMNHFHWVRAMGSDILLIDERGCGASEGRFYTYGVNESRDILLWAEEMHRRFPQKPVYLFGTSLGGASVLQTISAELPGWIRGIIADSAFTSPYELFCVLMNRRSHLPAHPAVDIACMYARRMAGVDLRCRPSTERIAEKVAADESSPRPLRLFLIHGGADRLVDSSMGDANIAAAKGERAGELSLCPRRRSLRGLWEGRGDLRENGSRNLCRGVNRKRQDLPASRLFIRVRIVS